VSRRRAALVAALVLALGALAGCGGGSSSTDSGTTSTQAKTTATPPPAPEPPPNAEEGTVFVSLGNAEGLGLVLADSEGHTLYAFSKDTPRASACTGACAKAWPPLLDENGEPQPSNGTSAARLGTIALPDGSKQVTYAGHPLYSFSGDARPGAATGNGSTAFGGTWTALKGSGAPAN
jgi:predicted lipoprotein with Yx(FWY)xxD motif